MQVISGHFHLNSLLLDEKVQLMCKFAQSSMKILFLAVFWFHTSRSRIIYWASLVPRVSSIVPHHPPKKIQLLIWIWCFLACNVDVIRLLKKKKTNLRVNASSFFCFLTQFDIHYIYTMIYTSWFFHSINLSLFAHFNLIWTFCFMTNTVRMNNHKLKAKYVCSYARLEAMC